MPVSLDLKVVGKLYKTTTTPIGEAVRQSYLHAGPTALLRLLYDSTSMKRVEEEERAKERQAAKSCLICL
jgi:hypothetical protein